MNPKSRDRLLIVVALLVILGAGFGLGSLVANRAAPADTAPPSVEVDQLQQETLAALRQSLHLTPEQEARIRPRVRNTAREVLDTRQRALLEYHRQMLRLHDRIAPDLDPDQREILLRNRRLLQDTIEKRFANLLPDEDAPPEGAPVNPEDRQ